MKSFVFKLLPMPIRMNKLTVYFMQVERIFYFVLFGFVLFLLSFSILIWKMVFSTSLSILVPHVIAFVPIQFHCKHKLCGTFLRCPSFSCCLFPHFFMFNAVHIKLSHSGYIYIIQNWYCRFKMIELFKSNEIECNAYMYYRGTIAKYLDRQFHNPAIVISIYYPSFELRRWWMLP